MGKKKISFVTDKEIPRKKEKREIVEAYPQVSMLAQIMIIDEKRAVPVGGFTMDGGFYLDNGFDLIKKKQKGALGEEMTYFNFVKDPKIKGRMEKHFLKQKREEANWKKKREKELEKELNNLRKKK